MLPAALLFPEGASSIMTAASLYFPALASYANKIGSTANKKISFFMTLSFVGIF
jgi:hypothetical protein